MADGDIVWDARAMQATLKTLDPRVQSAIRAAFGYHSSRAVAYARQNAPWTDRTTNARNGLFARVETAPRLYRLVIGHGVPYGIWLETRWSGRYAIIRPTVDHTAPLLMYTARTLVRKVLTDG